MIVQNIFLEQRLIKAEKVEVASHLAASISHEIRNPLTASKGFMQLLYEDVPKSRHEYLNIAIQELNQAESVIRNYLTFAKPSLERPEAISVTDIVETVIGIAEPLAAEHEVKINYDQANLSIHVLGDRIRLQQALLNIVKNGIEAMPNGGELTIDLQMKDSVVTIEVKDTGIGMSTEQMNRLGEPYFSTKEKGTGLGMMVTYRIIQTMQGQIIVTSEKQKGTSFTVEIPVHERAS
nr:ATP-binding protein [Bacillus kexueae]